MVSVNDFFVTELPDESLLSVIASNLTLTRKRLVGVEVEYDCFALLR